MSSYFVKNIFLYIVVALAGCDRLTLQRRCRRLYENKRALPDSARLQWSLSLCVNRSYSRAFIRPRRCTLCCRVRRQLIPSPILRLQTTVLLHVHTCCRSALTGILVLLLLDLQLLSKMTEYEFATFELLLDTSEVKDEKTKTVQVGVGEPFQMKCNVKGEHHEEPDLSWLKDGKEIPEIDALNITDTSGAGPSKSIVVTGFDATKHSGVYECGVKRKDKKFHRRSLKIEQKPGNAQIADGFAACSTVPNPCHNNGFCMMHKASKSISCLCINQQQGQRCEFVQPTADSRIIVPSSVQASMAAMGFALFGLLIIVVFAFVFITKQKRQLKSISGKINKRYSNEGSQYADVEMSLLRMEQDQPDKGILKQKFVAIESPNTAQFCWNCGYSQVLINGSYQKRPSNAQITRLPGSTRGSPSGSMHRTPSFRGPGNKDIVETGHGAILNLTPNGLIRVASIPTMPSAMGPFFEDFDRNCPDCLAQLRAHYYPDSPDMYDTPPFDGLPNPHHLFDHRAQRTDFKKRPSAVTMETQTLAPVVRPAALDLNAKSRSRLQGVSGDERLEVPPYDSRKAASSPSTPKSQRRMTLTNTDQKRHQHATTTTSVDSSAQKVSSSDQQLA